MNVERLVMSSFGEMSKISPAAQPTAHGTLFTHGNPESRKGKAMPPARCACGFTEDEAEDYALSDHLYEVFAPEDGKGPDGLVHLEGERDLSCMCGAGGSQEKLDAHFLEVFTPADSTNRDGAVHRVAG